MCGRLNLSDLDGIRQLMAQIGMPLYPDTMPRFNVAPTSSVSILRQTPAATGQRPNSNPDSRPQWQTAHWGMPIRTASGSTLTINARAESARDKPLFKPLIDGGRAVVVASGFYEWQQHGPTRRAFHFTATQAPALLFAGLWRTGLSGGTEMVILTTSANADITDVHHRMPVFLQHDNALGWLNGTLNWGDAIAPSAEGSLTRRQVASHVNDARHDHPNCLDAASSEPFTQDLFD